MNVSGKTMNSQLLLENIRNVLIRLEETIIFGLIERAQFKTNRVIYTPGAWPEATGQESIMGFLLHRTECNHSLLRRYTSPDEHPFFSDLPPPALPRLRFDENPLLPNQVNLNREIREHYEASIVPFICQDGDDSQHGSSAVCDVNCLQALSKRIHYGKFVAESKYREQPEAFAAAIEAGDCGRLHEMITDRATEERVLRRVARKALNYGRDLDDGEAGKDCGSPKIQPEQVVRVYREWIIPTTKRVEVLYLLERLRG